MKSIVIALLVAATLVSSCGKKADPRAPELASPQRILDLRAQQDPKGISLTWNRPTRYVDGRELRDLASFVIYRKDLPQTCPDCPVPYRPLITVFVEDRDRFVKQRQYRYIDESADPNAVYRYRVSAQLFDGTLSEPSNEIEITRGP
jgi:hypothetical protein